MASLSYIEGSGLAWATKKTISLKKSTVNNENEEEEEKRGMKKGEEEKDLRKLETEECPGRRAFESQANFSVREIYEQSLSNGS